MKRVGLVVMLVAIVSLLAGCSSSLGGSGTPNLAGNWTGTVSDDYFGNGTFTASLNQSENSVSGDYTSTYPMYGTNTGQFTGTVSGATPNLAFTIEVAGCTASGTGTATSTHIAGSFTYQAGCVAAGSNGTFAADKQ